MATARSGCSSTVRDVLYIRHTSSRSIRAPAPPTEIGRGAGEGYTINFPLEAGATDADYDKVYAAIARVLDQFEPDLLLVSAGFDAHEDDPLASMRVTTSGYAGVIAHLKRAADRHCPIAVVTEGGYDLDALDACLDASLHVLRETPAERAIDGPSPRADRTLAAVRAAQADRWRAL